MYRAVYFICWYCVSHGFLFVTSYENIAMNKAAYFVIDDDLRKDANVLVDGRKSHNAGQCMSIEGIWKLLIDLGDILSIHHVTTYIKDTARLGLWATFGIRVSNRNDSSGPECNWLLIQIEQSKNNITCKFHGRYVILDVFFSKPRELCEVEIYGCHTPGRYGQNCSIPCPQNCQEGRCDISEGTCLECINGYKGPRCNKECDIGSFGRWCREICGKCKGNNTCHHIIGTCMEGCNPGFTGLQCNQECGNNTFGKGCTGVCGHCSENESCHHINGTCLNGCDPGFRGLKCNKECLNGSHGQNCTERCGSNCIVCNAVNGVCDFGCSSGWKGDFCEQKCFENTYGVECKESCGNCTNREQCHHVNGNCPFGCDAGVYGIKCDQECPYGRYGVNCSQTCPSNCKGGLQ